MTRITIPNFKLFSDIKIINGVLFILKPLTVFKTMSKQQNWSRAQIFCGTSRDHREGIGWSNFYKFFVCFFFTMYTMRTCPQLKDGCEAPLKPSIENFSCRLDQCDKKHVGHFPLSNTSPKQLICNLEISVTVLGILKVLLNFF